MTDLASQTLPPECRELLTTYQVTEMSMEKHIMTKMGLLSTQVCSESSFEDALDWLCRENPAGTTNNWSKDERKEVAPVQCEKFPTRKHYIFTC